MQNYLHQRKGAWSYLYKLSIKVLLGKIIEYAK
jgi:hypothetical protein